MANAIMVNNKQVNFWRGDMTPPTIYHIWIKDNSKMLLYDGSKWVVFLDNKEIIEAIDKLRNSYKNFGFHVFKIDKYFDNKRGITVGEKIY